MRCSLFMVVLALAGSAVAADQRWAMARVESVTVKIPEIAACGAGRSEAAAVVAPVVKPVGTVASNTAVRVREWKPVAVAAVPLLDDPLLAPDIIWGWGPMGQIREAALRARAKGDAAKFGSLEEEYWRMYSAALERRAKFINAEQRTGGQRER